MRDDGLGVCIVWTEIHMAGFERFEKITTYIMLPNKPFSDGEWFLGFALSMA